MSAARSKRAHASGWSSGGLETFFAMSTPESGTVPDNTDAYYLALGRFIDSFAAVEKLLLTCMRIWCGIPDNIARAIFSGVRTDAATNYITRTLTVTNADQSTKDDFQYIFTQLGHINAIRNLVVHYGTNFSDSENISS